MKTTKKDFELFKSECQKWIDRFGLTEWTVHFKFNSLSDRYIRARTNYDINAGSAAITLNRDSENDPTKVYYGTSLADTAKHEVLHLLFAKLSSKATSRYLNDGELEEAEHAILMRLMKVL